ncbi:transposase [Streptococcus pneumoniae]|nr:transposase [Streptococcus pneumoniae]
MENWGKASRICFTLEKEKRLRNRPAPTLNLLVNPSNSGLKLSIFAWRMGKGTEMQDNYTTKGKHLTIDSRRLIERWKKEGKSNREIASLLGKAPQTIHTKIKRRTVRQCLGKGRFKEIYSADYAQQS